jgi:hypothetical protein
MTTYTTATQHAEVVTLADPVRVTQWTRPADGDSHRQITACSEEERLEAVSLLLMAGFTPVQKARPMLKGGIQ